MRFIFLALLFSVTLQAAVQYPVVVKKGGTGGISFTSKGLMMGNGTNPLSVVPGISYGTVAGQLNFIGASGTSGGFFGQGGVNATDIYFQNADAGGINFYTNGGSYRGGWLVGGAFELASGGTQLTNASGLLNVTGGLSIDSGPTLAKHSSGDFILGNNIFLVFKTGGAVMGALKGYSTTGIAILDSSQNNPLPIVTSGGAPSQPKVTITGSGTTGTNTFVSDDGASYVSGINPGVQTIAFGRTLNGTVTCTCSMLTGASVTSCTIGNITSTGATFYGWTSTPAASNQPYTFACTGTR